MTAISGGILAACEIDAGSHNETILHTAITECCKLSCRPTALKINADFLE